METRRPGTHGSTAGRESDARPWHSQTDLKTAWNCLRKAMDTSAQANLVRTLWHRQQVFLLVLFFWTLFKWVKVILWRPVQEKRDDKLAPTIPAEEAADLLLDKQKALEVWRNRHVFTHENTVGALVVSNTAGLLGQGLQAPRSFQRKQGGTARWETLSDFNIL